MLTTSSPLLLVFLGGGLGSVLRYLMGGQAAKMFGPMTALSGWPWGTFLVNVIGCFVMGLAFRLLPLPDAGEPNARLLLMTGVLGGFTTFSAFSLDASLLWMRQDLAGMSLYIIATMFSTLAGVALGLAIGKTLT